MLLYGTPSGYTSSGLNIGGDTSTITGANAKNLVGDNDGYPWGWGGGKYDGTANLQAAIAYVKSVSPNALCAQWSGSPTSGGGRINWYNMAVSNQGRGTMQIVDGSSWVAIQFAAGVPGGA